MTLQLKAVVYYFFFFVLHLTQFHSPNFLSGKAIAL